VASGAAQHKGNYSALSAALAFLLLTFLEYCGASTVPLAMGTEGQGFAIRSIRECEVVSEISRSRSHQLQKPQTKKNNTGSSSEVI
jgi:hypothetical protein